MIKLQWLFQMWKHWLIVIETVMIQSNLNATFSHSAKMATVESAAYLLKTRIMTRMLNKTKHVQFTLWMFSMIKQEKTPKILKTIDHLFEYWTINYITVTFCWKSKFKATRFESTCTSYSLLRIIQILILNPKSISAFQTTKVY